LRKQKSAHKRIVLEFQLFQPLLYFKLTDHNDQETFIKEAMLLRQALSLCRSLVDEDKRLEAAYLEAVRTLLPGRKRSMGKRLLKKYKYPPEGVEDALNTVIGQCEMWADNGSSEGL
jgi:hypothetical protein